MGYLMSESSLQKNYLTHSWKDKEVHVFPIGISLEVNVLVQLEFRLILFKATVQHFSYYVMGTPPSIKEEAIQLCSNYLYKIGILDTT